MLKKLYACDGLVFVVPEWGGMVPPALINLLLLTANGSANGLPLGHKPAFIVGVSASAGGSYPISQLRGYAAKNSHINWIPLHVIVRNGKDFLIHPWTPEGENRFSEVQARLMTGLECLYIYAKQLKGVRENLISLFQRYPYGQ